MRGLFLFFPGLLAAVFVITMQVVFPPAAIVLGGMVFVIILINYESILGESTDNKHKPTWVCHMWMYLSNAVITVELFTFVAWLITNKDLGDLQIPILVGMSAGTLSCLFISLITTWLIWMDRNE